MLALCVVTLLLGCDDSCFVVAYGDLVFACVDVCLGVVVDVVVLRCDLMFEYTFLLSVLRRSPVWRVWY